MMRVTSMIFVRTLLLLGMSWAVAAQAPTSENNDRLKNLLERFPAADAASDGVLTRVEEHAAD